MIRLAIGRIVRTMYRVDVSGLDAIPAEGAALVVANHQSFIDAFILGGLSQREIRFVMDHRMAQLPGMKYFFQLTGRVYAGAFINGLLITWLIVSGQATHYAY